jgi:signal transduction histidine kinase/CheY-like chemotaxis protein
MTTELTLIVLGSSVQVIGALLFAAVLFHFERRAGRDYLRFWIWSWLAFAMYTTGSTASRLLSTSVEVTAIGRVALTTVSLTAGFLQLIWFLLGSYEFSERRRLLTRWVLPSCAVAFTLGLALTLAWIDDPAARTGRYLARAGVRSVATGIAFVLAAIWFARHSRGAWNLGRGLLPVALVLYGLDQTLYFLLGLPLNTPLTGLQRVRPAYGYVDVLLLLMVGLGMLLWMLEREREDRQAHWKRLAEAERLEAVGRLAAGVAHDFNNLLTAIGGNTDLALQNLKSDHDARPFLAEIKGATQRAVSVTSQLLTFARKHTVRPAALELNAAVTALAGMLRRLLGEDISLDVRTSATPAPVSADPGLVDQLLLNLTVNARAAMPPGGRLTIDVSVVHQRRADFACLSVTDTGSGITPEHLPHIFEPFFTTKEAGHGTGLGLATSYAVVQQHGGWIDVDTKVGRGTTFRVYLPIDTSERVEVAAPVPDTPTSRKATILVVEDEEQVRKFVNVALTAAGHDVIDAANGPAVLAMSDGQLSRVSLLLTDVVMPGGMTGPELIVAVRERSPAVRVVLTSGYHRELPDTAASLQAVFLPKPFNADTLTRSVRQCLDEV